jgi:hypothetical protein
MANVHTAERFDLDLPGGAYERMARALEDDEEWAAVEETDWFSSAQSLAEEQDFFHWKLEFPEAFYEEDGSAAADAGFDAVIGNPPYVRMEQIKPLKNFLESEYETHAARTDLYVYFIEQSAGLLRTGGEYGAIISNKFLRAKYGKGVRRFLAQRTFIREIVDFGGLPVFPDATVRSAIVLARNNDSEQGTSRYVPVDTLKFASLGPVIEKLGYEVAAEGIQGEDWRLTRREVSELMTKIENYGDPLIEIIDAGQVCWGIKTGLNEAFILSEGNDLVNRVDCAEEIIKPSIKGKEVRRFHLQSKRDRLLYLPHGVNIDQYPEVKDYLAQYRDQLEGRATNQAWYELQQPQEAYKDYFEGPKILYPEIAPEARFAFHPGPLYPNNKCFFIPTEKKYLTALLNSKLTLFYLKNVLAKLEGRSPDDVYYEFRAQYMEDLPVWHPGDDGHEHQKSLRELTERATSLRDDRYDLNLDLLDYLRSYDSEKRLSETGTYQPPSGVGDTHLAGTTEDHDSLRIGTATCEREDETTVTVHATARYKPENEDAHETDQYGYTETDPIPAMRLTDLTETEADLVEAFVPVAVEEGGGFAGFRDNATKTISPLDRLEAITLPEPDEVADDLERYWEAVERAEELEAKIERTDELIDEIVYELYGLTEEEIGIVEAAVED